VSGPLSIDSHSASHFRLSWDEPAESATGFIVSRRRAGEPDWTEIARLPGTARGFESTGMLEHECWEHRLCSHDLDGTIQSSRTIAATTSRHDALARGKLIAPRTGSHPRVGEGSIARWGDWLIYVYGRYQGSSDYAHASLAVRVSHDEGQNWSDEKVVLASPHQLALPALISIEPDALLLSYVEIRSEQSASRVVRRSTDGGTSWSPAVAISDRACGYMTGSHDRLVRLDSGRLIYPVHAFGEAGDLVSFVYVSDDAGETWRRTTRDPLRVASIGYPASFQHGFWEASVCQTASGALLMLGRTAMGRLYKSRSRDAGESWSDPQPTDIIAPTAPANLARLDAEKILLVWSPHFAPGGAAGGPRLVLGSMVSEDGGSRWGDYRQIEYDGANWFSYPSTFVDTDGTVHLTYYGENDAIGDARGNGNIFGGSRHLAMPAVWFDATGFGSPVQC
jgi:sialidase-1